MPQMSHLPEWRGEGVCKSKFKWDIRKNQCKIDFFERDIFVLGVVEGAEGRALVGRTFAGVRCELALGWLPTRTKRITVDRALPKTDAT